MSDELAIEQVAWHDAIKSTRNSQFTPTWQMLSQYFLPNQSNINTQKLPGTASGWTQDIYNTVAITAAQILGAGQGNWITPANEVWSEYTPPEYLTEEGKEEDLDDVTQWLEKASDITMRRFSQSNFYAMMAIDNVQTGIFGTGMMFLEQGKNTPFNFRQFKPWHLSIEENSEGVVDSVGREFELTTRQAVQQFGLDAVGPAIAKAYGDRKGAGMSKKWKFLHRCFPREDSKRIEGRMDGPNKPVASIYISMADSQCVEISGYDEMPYMCSRFMSWGAETPWGYGPAYLTLANARQLNYIQQYRDSLAELRAQPRFLMPSYLSGGDVDLRAGGATFFDETIANGKPEEWMTQGDDRSAMENMQEHAEAINRAFYVDIFKMLGSEPLVDKKMTAYEISQRMSEKLELFTPVSTRRVTEFINPLMKRAFGMLYRAGEFGQAPQALMRSNDGGRTYQLAMPQIAVTSRISQAMKAVQNNGMVKTLETIMPLAEARPEVMDNYDLDEWAREIARNNSVPASGLVKLKTMAQIRQARAEQAQQQQAAELAQRMGGTLADLGKAPKPVQDAVIHQFA